ncbi:hypothetical protein A3L04_08115 [Thermococcus chitonophagus]|uniref:MIP18 family-like domain-containing protein n=1 Tax=Thermococcus chitonophagus TaxID=54262 RepID=A0A161KAE1_9EURY|nr:iron-sulfur cluster assembly protein [Thermococcus chitonophagus]ASJ17038.1 hypothetical protein A3L04_08115 [Thermococcus chitonophagus]CUX77628.1 hypothetical protein CHITON_0849 [Thermococcus chitonophagus]
MFTFKIFRRRKPNKQSKKLPEDVKKVVDILKKVEDPETGINIVHEGLLYGVTVRNESVDVFLLMASSTPHCHFCRMIALQVQRKIVAGCITALKDAGFKKVKVYNELGLLLAEG